MQKMRCGVIALSVFLAESVDVSCDSLSQRKISIDVGPKQMNCRITDLLRIENIELLSVDNNCTSVPNLPSRFAIERRLGKHGFGPFIVLPEIWCDEDDVGLSLKPVLYPTNSLFG